MWINMEKYRKKPLYLSTFQKMIQGLPNDEKREIRLLVFMNQKKECRALTFEIPRRKILTENKDLFERYILAMVNNMIVSFGGESLIIYYDKKEIVLSELITKVINHFQIGNLKNNRSGYGVYINYINRMNTFLGSNKFVILEHDLSDWIEPDISKIFRIYRPDSEEKQLELLRRSAFEMEGKMFVSLDVGGNSIKGAVVSDGKVIVVKEYRWYPTGLKTAEEMNNPQIVMLRFLINYALAIFAESTYVEHALVLEAMCCDASYSSIEKANQYLESSGFSPYNRADAIVIGFPDIVVLNKIAGGESFKHRGMKNNPNIDYEKEFFETSNLDEKAKVFVKKDHPVIILNDGNTASFLISVEQACNKGSMLKENGMFANTVGTEFGTGFISRGGTIQYIPMEGFQHIIDLGNTDYSQYDDNDVRSTRNMNTTIPGTIQKYVSQLGLFRMAMSAFCEFSWPTVQGFIDKGLFSYDEPKDLLQVVTDPVSTRDTITRILVDEMLSEGNEIIEDVFKSMGKALGVLMDQDKLIFPEVEGTRLLSGGIVACDKAFSIISNALFEHNNEYKVIRLDESSACIPLLRSIPIDKRSFTVAIGSAFIGNRFLIQNN